eukprot:TRINITY_DN3169_c0_g1_i1.p1 TRINITY_DN3169_c0_g1~~TRINITY_DN3169_c0_g1_i1.p1  ORF type:complete len:258 (+),score=25.81 TRINITY_DN3169_c0_g1_i1:101-775(+)
MDTVLELKQAVLQYQERVAHLEAEIRRLTLELQRHQKPPIQSPTVPRSTLKSAKPSPGTPSQQSPATRRGSSRDFYREFSGNTDPSAVNTHSPAPSILPSPLPPAMTQSAPDSCSASSSFTPNSAKFAEKVSLYLASCNATPDRHGIESASKRDSLVCPPNTPISKPATPTLPRTSFVSPSHMFITPTKSPALHRTASTPTTPKSSVLDRLMTFSPQQPPRSAR